MSGKIQLRLAILAAVAGLVVATVSSGLVAGADNGQVLGESSVVLLSLGEDNEVTWENNTQPISTRRNKCTPTSFGNNPQLLAVTTVGGALGFDDSALGVASNGEGNSGKCAQVNSDRSESLTISLGTDLDSYVMDAIDLDLELKFNAEIEVTYKLDGVTLATDMFDGMGSDDGPDSADNDNYRYASAARGIDVVFDAVMLRPTSGAFSLEAGADGTEDGSLDDNALSQFRVVQVFDGEITCGDSVLIADAAVPTIFGTVTLHAMDPDVTPDDPPFDWTDDVESELSPCVLKPFLSALNATDDSAGDGIVDISELEFVPVLESTIARYTIEVTVMQQLIESNGDGQVTSLEAVYDPNPLDEVVLENPLQACESQPPGVDLSKSWTDQDLSLLPAGESACYFSALAMPTGTNGSGETIGTEVWNIFFLDDPGVKFR